MCGHTEIVTRSVCPRVGSVLILGPSLAYISFALASCFLVGWWSVLPQLWVRSSPELWVRSFPELWVRSFPELWVRSFPELWVRSFPELWVRPSTIQSFALSMRNFRSSALSNSFFYFSIFPFLRSFRPLSLVPLPTFPSSSLDGSICNEWRKRNIAIFLWKHDEHSHRVVDGVSAFSGSATRPRTPLKPVPYAKQSTLIEVAGWQILADATKDEMRKWLNDRKNGSTLSSGWTP